MQKQNHVVSEGRVVLYGNRKCTYNPPGTDFQVVLYKSSGNVTSRDWECSCSHGSKRTVSFKFKFKFESQLVPNSRAAASVSFGPLRPCKDTQSW